MRAITVNEYGAAPELTEVPDPQPGRRQVLIRVEAAGMNPMDRSMAGGVNDHGKSPLSIVEIPQPLG
jgi:NADPH2:quinone reductase